MQVTAVPISVVVVTRCIVLAWSLCVGVQLFALDPKSEVTQYGFDTWTARDGLPQNSVRAVQQAADGYLWLGTRAGLVRFDGVTFTIFNSSNTPALAEDHILSMAAAPDGTIWAASTDGVLVSTKAGLFRRHSHELLKGNVIRALAVDSRGRLWIGTEKVGLLRVEQGRFVHVPTAQTAAAKQVRSLYEDRSGVLWVGTDDGLFRIDAAAGFPVKVGNPALQFAVWAITGDGSGGLYLGTKLEGLIHYKDGSFTRIALDSWLRSKTILALSKDRHGNLWIGSDGDGLGRLTAGRLSPVTILNGLSNQIVRSVLEDREGGIWVGAAGGGLTRLRDQVLTSITIREGMPTDMIRSAFRDSSGAMWLGSAAGIVRLQNGRVDTYGERHGVPGPLAWPVFRDRQGTIWAGGSQARLVTYPGGHITRTNARCVLDKVQVRAFYQDRAGVVWVGCVPGLFRFRGGHPQTDPSTATFQDISVTALLETRDGRMWVGTNKGLYVRRDAVFAPVNVTALPSNKIVVLHEDAEGNVWIGSPKGLGVIREGSVRHLGRSAGIPEVDVYGLAEDGRGGFWITGRTGLNRVPAQQMRELARGVRRNVIARSFSTGDSLRGSAEFNFGAQPLIATSGDGRIWVPSYGGVVIADSAKIDTGASPPPVYVERVVLDDHVIGASSAAGHRLEFYFTVLTYVAPQSVRFRYMLQGFDEDWVEGGTRRHALYTAVPPGRYTFTVQAANSDGLWNSEVAAFTLDLTPRFYQTWWFMGLCAVAVMGVIAGAHGARVRSLRQREATLARRVAEATKELQAEIAERRRAEQAANCASRAKSDFLANMSHEIRTPMNAVIGMTELVLDSQMSHQQRQQVEIVKDSAESLLCLLNEVLDFSKIEAGKLELHSTSFSLRDTVAAALNTVSARARQKGLRLAWIVRHDMPDELIGDCSRLRQVLLNIIGNAVKFTERGEIVVSVRADTHDPGLMFFEVADTGIGIAAEQQERVFHAFTQADDSAIRRNGGTGLGLAISSQLIKLMGGAISVESTLGHGSTFRFHVRFQAGPRHEYPFSGRTVYLSSAHRATLRSLTELVAHWGLVPVFDHQPCDFAIIDTSDDTQRPHPACRQSVALTWAEAAGCTPSGFDARLMKPVGPSELLRFLSSAGITTPKLSTQQRRGAAARILVAEDNAVNQKITRAMLEREGHTVTVVGDGRQAVAAVERESYDVVLMDVQMPEMDGLQATAILRSRGCTLPIIALTACASSDDAQRCVAAGMNTHLAKPVRRAELLAALATYECGSAASHDGRGVLDPA